MNKSKTYLKFLVIISALALNFCLANKFLNFISSNQKSTQTLASSFRFSSQQFKLLDTSQQDRNFYQFLEQLRQKVRERDAQFVHSIMVSDIQLSFGSDQEVKKLNLENPDALSWLHLEKAIAIGCSSIQVNPSHPANWQCPPLDPIQSKEISPFEQVFIVGQQVNARSQPKLNSSILQTVSWEIVEFDYEGLSQLSSEQQETMSTLYSWIPVILANGQHGYVSSRYAYQLTGYRVVFTKLDGKWQLASFLAGD